MKTAPIHYILLSLIQHKSLTRSFLNWETRSHILKGRVLDIGAGKTTDYHEMPKEEGVKIQGIDKKTNKEKTIDFEKDTLPYTKETFDMVLIYNVLEHIFNHNHLTSEAYRVLKSGGELVGFVPFMMWYHPDPHDYFRYTGEALERILEAAGFVDVTIKPLSRAMFAVQFQSMSQSLPKVIAILLYPVYHLLDSVYLRLRPHAEGRYALGYFFTAKKHD